MPAYHAHDHADYFFAGLVALCVLSVVIFLGRPWQRYTAHKDDARMNAVEDIFQAIIELRLHDSAEFAGLVGRVAPGRIMIGSAGDCVGTYGTQCKDAFLNDACYDLTDVLKPYLASLPYDTSNTDASAEKSGYYLEVRDRQLIVGACDPEGRETIELSDPL